MLLKIGIINSLRKKSNLFDFNSFTFRTANTTGRIGPSLIDLLNFYDTFNNTWLNNADNFISINGVQIFTIPITGIYRIIAKGSQGAPYLSTSGGRGAIISGEFSLNAGDKIQMLVGQIGPINSNRLYRSSPGGGGSFVIKYTGETNTIDDILLIAGGGGGTGDSPIDTECDAQIGTTGGRARRNNNNFGGTGGIDGNGGNIGNATANGAGGGFLTNGQTSSQASGLSFLNGGLGGGTNNSFAPSGGGFGGGGAPNNGDLNRFSGGGGFSGGGASNTGSDSQESNVGGGGGSSYNSGSNQINLTGSDGNYGEGSIYIELLNI
jgi:hypothetical protein